MLTAGVARPTPRRRTHRPPAEGEPVPWTPAEAAEHASAGGRARARQLQKSPEERAVEAVRSKAPDLMKELLAAAMADGDFENIKTETRVSAILRALEYGIGRPAPAVKAKPEVAETGGLTLA